MPSEMDFEVVDIEAIPYHSQCAEYVRSLVCIYMRASWFRSAIHELITKLPHADAQLVDSLVGRVSPGEMVRTAREHNIAIFPLILSSFVPHMVLIISDRVRKRVIYYNPTGCSPLNEYRRITNITSTVGVLQLLNMVSHATDTHDPILYSPMMEQGWFLSCGAHCRAFIERALVFPDLLTLLPLSIQIGAERRIIP
jgi:hypothetical protein